jgi:outer membrane protein OmpA-like peptidoglycan-associated protein
MMRRHPASCLAILLLAAACAATQKPQPREAFIVLLPDDQGKTGSIVVSGSGGERVLSAPRQAVRVSAGAAPGNPSVIPGDEVCAQVGPALAALPPPPVRVILYFEHNSDDLTKESLAQLPEVIRTIRKRAPVDLSVVGHTDTVGDKSYNYRLSLMRAKAVAALLVAKGLDPSILEITSHGKDNPLVPTGDQVFEPRNRRVEVTVR